MLDASAALSGLLNAGAARESLAHEQLHAPHLVDSEVASGLRRQVTRGRIATDDGWRALRARRRLSVTRCGTCRLPDRIWELRDKLLAYEAGCVASPRRSTAHSSPQTAASAVLPGSTAG